jgi:protein-disulfide isomerase
MRILLYILSLLALASCTIPGAITPSTNTPTTPVEPAKKSPVETTLYGSGKHIIQIYADFQCPGCIAFSQNYADIFEAYATSGKVQLQFKQYPLTNMHKNAYRDALASLCASDQKKYGDYKV